MALLKTILLGIAVGYFAIALLIWVGQERIMFLARPATAFPAPPPGWTLENVAFKSTDGTVLAGVLAIPPTPRPGLVIYYGGNAEEVTAYAPAVDRTYGARAVLLMNYRGYGASQGSPGEKAIVADAIEIFDWAARRAEFDSQRIALHGRSLGSGVATAVAATRPARCVVLTTPFDSALEVAARLYPWLPVAWMLRHPFDSAALAPAIRQPALILIGEADTIIPRRHSERLAERWGGPVEKKYFAGFGHNDLQLHPAYDPAVRGFLDRCA